MTGRYFRITGTGKPLLATFNMLNTAYGCHFYSKDIFCVNMFTDTCFDLGGTLWAPDRLKHGQSATQIMKAYADEMSYLYL